MRTQATTINTQDIDKLANNLASIAAAVRETVTAAQIAENRQKNT